MLDSSNNLTLEEEIYEQNELESLGISEVKYEEKYNFLEEESFQGEHLQLSRLRLNPPLPKYQMHFYESGEEIAEQTEETWSNATNQKIGTFKSEHGERQDERIKLPLNKENVLLQINSSENSPLRGKLLKTLGESQIALFDHAGKEKGRLSYHLQEIRKRKEESAIVNESITLQEKDFLEDIASIKKRLEEENGRRRRIEVNNRSTLKTDQEAPPLQEESEHSEESEAMSQKSEIDYMGYEGGNSRIIKAAEYRLPLESKSRQSEPIRIVDFSTIKKSMDNLGLPNNNNLEKFLERKRVLESIEQQQIIVLPEKTLVLPQALDNIRQSQRCYNDFSTQMEQKRPQMKEYGVGTYTPIPSRMMDQRAGSSISQRKSQLSLQSIKQKKPARPKKKVKVTSEEEEPIPKTQLHRSKLRYRDSPISLQSIKHDDSIIKRNQLSMRNRVYQIRVGESRAGSRLDDSKRKDWASCKDTSSNHPIDHTDSQDSVLYPQFDFCVNNLSVNFHQQSFGSKFVELTITPMAYRTQQLRGSNLIWIGKHYLFRGVSGHCELVVSVKTENDHVEQTLGRVRVRLSDIILNRKKSYFQTFLLGNQSVLAIVIIGFEVIKKTLAMQRRPIPLKLARQSHAQTEFSRSKTTKVQGKISRKAKSPQQIGATKLPQSRPNPIRARKYIGGRNIKIGRASRFQQDGLGVPGPGDYFIQSSFSRHALKDY